MQKITKDSLIGEVLEMDIDLAKYFFEIGMHCLGCPSAKGETIEEACQVHNVDCDELLKKLNGALKA